MELEPPELPEPPGEPLLDVVPAPEETPPEPEDDEPFDPWPASSPPLAPVPDAPPSSAGGGGATTLLPLPPLHADATAIATSAPLTDSRGRRPSIPSRTRFISTLFLRLRALRVDPGPRSRAQGLHAADISDTTAQRVGAKALATTSTCSQFLRTPIDASLYVYNV